MTQARAAFGPAASAPRRRVTTWPTCSQSAPKPKLFAQRSSGLQSSSDRSSALLNSVFFGDGHGMRRLLVGARDLGARNVLQGRRARVPAIPVGARTVRPIPRRSCPLVAAVTAPWFCGPWIRSRDRRCEWMVRESEVFRGKRVLELGTPLRRPVPSMLPKPHPSQARECLDVRWANDTHPTQTVWP